MKQIFQITILVLLFISCSSDEEVKEIPVAFDSQIFVNGSKFKIENAFSYSASQDGFIYIQFIIDDARRCDKCPYAPNYKRIILNIYCNISELENTFDLALPITETKYIYGGYYLSGFPINFYSGTVNVSKINAERYKIEFNSVKGKFFLENNNETEFEGYFEGNFKEIDNPFQQ